MSSDVEDESKDVSPSKGPEALAISQSHELSEKRKEGCEENQPESSQESKSKGLKKQHKDTLENENKPKLNIKI